MFDVGCSQTVNRQPRLDMIRIRADDGICISLVCCPEPGHHKK